MLKSEIDLYPKADPDNRLIVMAEYHLKTKKFRLSAKRNGEKKVLKEDF